MGGFVVNFMAKAGINLQGYVLISPVLHGLYSILKGLVIDAARVFRSGYEMYRKICPESFPIRGIAILHEEKKVQETVCSEDELAKGI